MTMMTQCRLIRHDGATQDAFINADLAVVDRVINLKIDGAWDRGWRVATVGFSQTAKIVAERERDHKKHRSATDV